MSSAPQIATDSPFAAASTSGSVSIATATAYLLFVAVLPPQMNPAIFASLILAGSILYLLPDLSGRIRDYVFLEYFVLAGLVALYLALSASGILRVPGRLFEPASIAPQAAGMMIVIAIVPALTKAACILFADKVRLFPLALLVGVSVMADLTWRQGEGVIEGGQLYGVLAPALFIQFTFFAAIIAFVPNPLVRGLLLIAPMPFLGAASNVVIQLTLVVMAILPFGRVLMSVLGIALAIGVVLAVTGEEWLDPFVRSDTNTLVRLQLWRYSFPDILEHPFGIGYGTAYSDVRAIADPHIHHVYKGNQNNALVIANHSSLIDVPLRLGVLGLIVFTMVLWRSFIDALRSSQAILGVSAIAMVLIIGAMNPALESAKSAIFVAFAIGLARGISLPSLVPGHQGGLNPSEIKPALTPAERRAELARLAS